MSRFHDSMVTPIAALVNTSDSAGPQYLTVATSRLVSKSRSRPARMFPTRMSAAVAAPAEAPSGPRTAMPRRAVSSIRRSFAPLPMAIMRSLPSEARKSRFCSASRSPERTVTAQGSRRSCAVAVPKVSKVRTRISRKRARRLRRPATPGSECRPARGSR